MSLNSVTQIKNASASSSIHLINHIYDIALCSSVLIPIAAFTFFIVFLYFKKYKNYLVKRMLLPFQICALSELMCASIALFLILFVEIDFTLSFSSDLRQLGNMNEDSVSSFHDYVFNGYKVDRILNLFHFQYVLNTLLVVVFLVFLLKIRLHLQNKSKLFYPILLSSINVILCICTLTIIYGLESKISVFKFYPFSASPFLGLEFILTFISFCWAYFIIRKDIITHLQTFS